jgi:hypothetical protein
MWWALLVHEDAAEHALPALTGGNPRQAAYLRSDI